MAAGDLSRSRHENNHMSYYKRYARGRRPAMGDLTSTISTVVDVATDPYLPEVVCHIQQLQQIGRNQPVQVCTDTPSSMDTGVGIGPAMPALRAFVYAQQNPWVYVAGVVAILGVPLWLGYELGKGG